MAHLAERCGWLLDHNTLYACYEVRHELQLQPLLMVDLPDNMSKE